MVEGVQVKAPYRSSCRWVVLRNIRYAKFPSRVAKERQASLDSFFFAQLCTQTDSEMVSWHANEGWTSPPPPLRAPLQVKQQRQGSGVVTYGIGNLKVV